MITTADVRDAADILRPVFDATGGQDGRVSIEVDPRLAHNTAGDHRRGQAAGLAGGPPEHAHQDPGDQGRPAGDHRGHRQGHQRQRHADLLAGALPRGHGRLPGRPGEGEGRRPGPVQDPLRGVLLRLPRGHRDRQAPGRRSAPTEAKALTRQGGRSPTPGWPTRRTRRSSPPTAGPRWTRRSANKQRPLWASTGVKDPAYKDTLYVDELVAPGTVNTMPEATLDATADHGEITGDTVRGTYEQARADLDARRRSSGSPTTRSCSCWRTRASRSSRRPGTTCSSPPRPSSSASLLRRADHLVRYSAEPIRCVTPQDRRLPRIAGPSGLVIFGVTGDLSRKKLMPAVYDLANRGLLPPGFSLVGFARREWEHEDFAQEVHDAVKEHARTPFREEVWQQLIQGMRFVQGDFDDDEAFETLKATIEELDKAQGTGGNFAFYLSVPPKFFPKVVQQLKKHGLADAAGGLLAPRGHREAVRPRPGLRPGAQPGRARGLPAQRGLPDRPLPGQGDRPEHPGAALRQHDVRADLEPVVRRPRPDHHGRGHRHRRPGRLLRRHRRRP